MNRQHQHDPICPILLFAGGYLMIAGMFMPIAAGLGVIAFAGGLYMSFGNGAALRGIQAVSICNGAAAKIKKLLAMAKRTPRKEKKQAAADPEIELLWVDCPANSNRMPIDARSIKWSTDDIEKLYGKLHEAGKESTGYALAFRLSRIMDSADFPWISVQKLMNALQSNGSYAFVRPNLFTIKTMKNVFERSGLLIRPSAGSEIHFVLICHQEGNRTSVTLYTILRTGVKQEKEYAKKLSQGLSEKCLAVEKQMIEIVNRELRAISGRG